MAEAVVYKSEARRDSHWGFLLRTLSLFWKKFEYKKETYKWSFHSPTFSMLTPVHSSFCGYGVQELF